MENLDLTNSNLLGEEFSYAKGKLRKKLKDKIKKGKEKLKKVTKNLKDKVGKTGKKFRNKFRGIMRKGILLNIKNNIHGTATKLYPAIAAYLPVTYKKSHLDKSKKVYAELLIKWKNLGGKEIDLQNAIRDGHTKRFLKNPYKSANGNNSWEFYNYFAPDTNIYEGSDGSQEGEESEDLSEEEPSKEEQVKGIRGFFAWLKSIFKREDADGNPFEDGTNEGKNYDKDKKEDAGNEPNESEANNDVVNELEKNKGEDDAGGASDKSAGEDEKSDDKILGLPKTAFWIGVGAIALIGGILIFRKIRK